MITLVTWCDSSSENNEEQCGVCHNAVVRVVISTLICSHPLSRLPLPYQTYSIHIDNIMNASITGGPDPSDIHEGNFETFYNLPHEVRKISIYLDQKRTRTAAGMVGSERDCQPRCLRDGIIGA